MIYNKALVDTCKKYNVDLGVQNVYTPIDVIENNTKFSFINAVPKDAKEVCILFNVEFFEYFIKQDYIKNNNIKLVFGYDCDFDKELINRCATVYEFKNYELINLTKFSKTKDIKEISRVMHGRKFDVVFSNPPYGNIDLNLLLILFENNISKKAIFIHPAGWLFDLKENSEAMKFKNKLSSYLTYVNIFDGEKLFNIEFHFPECISIFVDNKQNSNITIIDNLINQTYQGNIYDISIFGNMKAKLYNNLIKKIKNNFSTNKSINKKYTFALMRIIGNARKSNDKENSGYPFFGPKFFTLIPKSLEDQKSYTMKTHDVFSFDTETELNNFKKFLTTKIARICLSFLKISQHLDSGRTNLIPWMDFTRSWNDKDLCEEFNISKELWDYIDQFIPDYYDDYKSGFETTRAITKKCYDNPSQEMVDFCGKDIIQQLQDKTYDKHWGQDFKHHPELPYNGTSVSFKKDGKLYWIQKSVNKSLNENSKYKDRIGYELYESLDGYIH